MPLYINAVCDQCKKYCQGGAFDLDRETAADYKNALRSINWKISDDEGTANLHLVCPRCTAASTSNEST